MTLNHVSRCDYKYKGFRNNFLTLFGPILHSQNYGKLRKFGRFLEKLVLYRNWMYTYLMDKDTNGFRYLRCIKYMDECVLVQKLIWI